MGRATCPQRALPTSALAKCPLEKRLFRKCAFLKVRPLVAQSRYTGVLVQPGGRGTGGLGLVSAHSSPVCAQCRLPQCHVSDPCHL